jgi:Na+/H+ antiporter NhaD/arsenite permease-like protein
MTPLIAQVLAEVKLPRFPYLMTLATSSNIGSVMTMTGNPQNMIIGSYAQRAGLPLDYPTFALHLVPVGLVCLALHVWFLQWLFRRDLPTTWEVAQLPEVEADRPLMRRTLLVLLGVGVAFCLKLHPAWSAMGGACVLFALNQNRPRAQLVLTKIDWTLLLFFCGLFIVVYALKSSDVTTKLWSHAGGLWRGSDLEQKLHLVWVSVVGSNVVSNVPFIALVEPQMSQLADPTAGWMLLAMATTFAGNLTLLGSVANIIVMETSGEPVGFWRYLRVGLPVTILSCVIGTGMLLVIT